MSRVPRPSCRFCRCARLRNFIEITSAPGVTPGPPLSWRHSHGALFLRGMRASSALPCRDLFSSSFPPPVYSRVPKKSSQELYGLICYAELRKKVGGCKQTANMHNNSYMLFMYSLYVVDKQQSVGVLSMHFTLRHKGLIAAMRELELTRAINASSALCFCLWQ